MSAPLAALLLLGLGCAAPQPAACARATPSSGVPAGPPPPAKGAATARWTADIAQPLAGVPLGRAFDFWWDLNNTRRFIPSVTAVRVDPASRSAAYQAFTIAQRIPFPTQPLATAARGAVRVVKREPGFISAHTTGLVIGPSGAAGGWVFFEHFTNFTPTGNGTRVDERATHTASFSGVPQSLVAIIARLGAEEHHSIWAATAATLAAQAAGARGAPAGGAKKPALRP